MFGINRYPYVDYNKVNLDWILRKLHTLIPPGIENAVSYDAQTPSAAEQAQARNNLGLGDIATESAPLAVDKGGTGSDTVPDGATNIGAVSFEAQTLTATEQAQARANLSVDAYTLEVVSYSAQTLTEAEKAQARYNIGIGGTKAIFFGDSWVDGTIEIPLTSLWTYLVATRLGLTELNYGVDGAGFCRPGNLIYTQLETAYSALSESDRYDVEYAFIMGGVNDWRHKGDDGTTLSTFRTAVLNAAEKAHTDYPNAKIVMCLCNTQQYYFSDTWANWIRTTQMYVSNHATFAPVMVNNLAECINFNSSWWLADELHPNVTGHMVLAGHILRGLERGDYEVNYFHSVPTVTTGVTYTGEDPHLFREGDYMTLLPVRWEFPTVAPGSQQVLCTLPTNCYPRVNTYYPAVYGNEIVGTICATSGGNVTFTCSSSTSKDACFSPLIRYRLNRAE